MVLATWHILHQPTVYPPGCEVGTIIILTLQKRKLRYREAKHLAQGRPASQQQSVALNPLQLGPKSQNVLNHFSYSCSFSIVHSINVFDATKASTTEIKSNLFIQIKISGKKTCATWIKVNYKNHTQTQNPILMLSNDNEFATQTRNKSEWVDTPYPFLFIFLC